jgi:hypothetical protein
MLLLLALSFLPRPVQGITALDEEASLLQGKVPLNTRVPALGLPQFSSPAGPVSISPCRNLYLCARWGSFEPGRIFILKPN